MGNKKLKSMWKCSKCNARVKRLYGEKFEKPYKCYECGSREFE